MLPVGHPHSAYIGAVLDYGLLGALVIFSFLLHMWRVFKTIADRSIEPVWSGFFRGAMACILLLLVQGVTDDSFMPTGTQPFLWLAYAVAIGLISRANSQMKLGKHGTPI
jgi:O-antigen ligase